MWFASVRAAAGDLMPGPVLLTARLMLRPPVEEDFESWAAFMADEESARYVGGVQAPAVAWRGLAQVAGSWALVGYGMYSVIERETGQWIGRVGPWKPHDWPGAEVGWGIARSHWGQGYAFEAACACMDVAVDRLGWSDIVHPIDPANIASQKLAQRLGSVNRGPGRLPPPNEDKPVDIWGQSADQWRRSRFYGTTIRPAG